MSNSFAWRNAHPVRTAWGERAVALSPPLGFYVAYQPGFTASSQETRFGLAASARARRF